ncbi:MAG: transcriptional regulator, family [Thermomicrobiales bacterium]|nr:transcriptional regulator, family [Thermomicrobiales bacterium]
MDERPPFSLVLKRFRLAAGLTHEALAERASLGARTISDLERGVSRAPRADTLALLIEALDLSPDQRALLRVAARPPLDLTPRAASSGRSSNHLPLPLTSFVGREREAGAVHDLLSRDDTRLVTLTGPGGVGKTRLALRVTAEVAYAYSDGIFAVDLAPISDPDSVCAAIARVLDVSDEGRPTLPSLIAALGEKRLMLLLDNFEHLLTAAPIVTEVLRACPHLKVLATSRAALRLSGEQEFPVPALPVPDPTDLPGVEKLIDYAAVRLFVDRAARVRPDFALTDDNAVAVAAICALLDGLPLAVELAAARVRTLRPQMLLERLQAANLPNLDLLTTGARDVPVRQQTLRDTIAWSHGLLDEQERTLFRRLAVFAGGCTLEAAETICNPPREPSRVNAAFEPGGHVSEINVFQALLALVDKSLLDQADGLDGASRFRMLETIRAFASEQLVASGEVSMVQREHATYYLSLVKATGALLFASERKQAMQAAEQGNVQAALQWLVQYG